jgi:hypothetical protein
LYLSDTFLLRCSIHSNYPHSVPIVLYVRSVQFRYSLSFDRETIRITGNVCSLNNAAIKAYDLWIVQFGVPKVCVFVVCSLLVSFLIRNFFCATLSGG